MNIPSRLLKLIKLIERKTGKDKLVIVYEKYDQPGLYFRFDENNKRVHCIKPKQEKGTKVVVVKSYVNTNI